MRQNFSITGYSAIDEVVNRADDTPDRIGHDLIKSTGFEVWTGAGKTGTQLVIDTHFTLTVKDTKRSERAGFDIFTLFAVIDPTYYDTDLYLTYTYHGDYLSVENMKELFNDIIPEERIPTLAEKAAMVGTGGTPDASNPFVTNEDTRLARVPSTGEKAALAGTSGTPSEANRYVTEASIGVDVAPLEDGVVPSTYLPSYVDDVLEFANQASFPSTGEASKIYVAIDTNLTFRWSGSEYVEISKSLAIGETSATAYRGDRGKTAYDHSQSAHAPAGADNTQTAINSASEKTTPVDGDSFPVLDSAASNALKKTTLANVKAVLKDYFDSFYSGGGTTASINIVADYEVPEIATGKSIVIRRTSAYDGNPVTITPPSGATFEGLSKYLLYEQYSSVTLERISSTLFVIQDEKINKLSEVGEIKAFAATVPKGFKACDGSAISRTTFPVLFAAIGTTFGAGNGSSTFNLPDLRETVLVGTGTRGTGVTAHDTYTLGQFKDDQMQGHRHAPLEGGSFCANVDVDISAGAGDAKYSVTSLTTTTGNPTPDGANGTPRRGSTTHGKQLGVNYAIRYA